MDSVKINKKDVLMVAHRGLSGIERENTAAAFIAAANRSYFGIETDVRKTKDGKFVCSHDGDLLRNAGIEAAVCDMTLDELMQLTLFDTDGRRSRPDLKIATLENYISICARYGKHAILELKGEFAEGELSEMIEIIDRIGHTDKVIFIAFNYDNLTRVRRLLPGHPVQFLCDKLTDDVKEKLLHDRFDLDIHHSGATKEVIDFLHGAALKINCWTVDSQKRAEELAELGVDYITSNILE